jgi:methylthioribose-1-phosphate isomerase
MHLICDSAAGHLLSNGKVDVVVFGADRVAANGDVANKIGTYSLAVVAHENNVPVYAAVPTSSIDFTIETGKEIVIEERNPGEVTEIQGKRIAPEGVAVFNPAFDVTPFRYITAIVTEEGICYPPYKDSLLEAKLKSDKRSKENREIRIQNYLKKLARMS